MYGVILNAAAFASPSWSPHGTHSSTRWQVREAGAVDWSTALTLDSGWDTVNLLAFYTGEVLDELTEYEARLAMRDELFLASDWSDPITIPPLETEEEQEKPPVLVTGGRRIRNLFFGSPNAILMAGRGSTDDGVDYPARVEWGPFAPYGYDAHAIMYRLYVAFKNLLPVTLHVAPIVDGLVGATTTIAVPLRGSLEEHEFEVELYAPYAGGSRYGLVGTHLGARVWFDEVADRRAEVIGVEAEIDRVEEQYPSMEFTPQSVTDISLQSRLSVFFGVDNRLARWWSGVDDMGEAINAIAVAGPVLPAGDQGECAARKVLMLLTRNNEADFETELVPIIDGVQLPAIPVTFPGVGGIVSEVVEVTLYQDYTVAAQVVSRHSPTGTSFAFLLRSTDGRPSGECIVEAMELDFDMIREQKVGV